MILNMVGFNIVWLGLVFFGDIFIPIALILLIIHLKYISNIKNETYYVLVVTFIGITFDSFLTLSGFFIFEEASVIPIWLMMLWACFATTLCHSLSFLERNKLLQLSVGGLFAPVSYFAGNKLQAVSFGLPTIQTFLFLSAIWAFLFIIFYSLKPFLIKSEVRYV